MIQRYWYGPVNDPKLHIASVGAYRALCGCGLTYCWLNEDAPREKDVCPECRRLQAKSAAPEGGEEKGGDVE